MLIDHVGLLFFPDNMLWRVIGRIAFPIYAYALVQGFTHTSNYGKYVIRLFVIAVLSQVPYQLAFHTNDFNVVATLFMAVLVLKVLQEVKSGIWSVLIISGMCVFLEILPFDYGAYGLLLVLIFKYGKSQMVLLHLLLNFIYLLAYGWLIQMMSIIPTLMIVYGLTLWRALESWRLPGWVWRSFYPVHLIILAAVVYWMGV
ncbi:TraX protein [compost metagenome]